MKIHYTDSSINIANYFLRLSFKSKNKINSQKLQRLIYLTYKTFLKDENEKLFTYQFAVYQSGPVLEHLHFLFKGLNGYPISDYIYTDSSFKSYFTPSSEKIKIIVKYIWNKYGHLDNDKLNKLITFDGSAWDKSVKENLEHIPVLYIYNEEIQ